MSKTTTFVVFAVLVLACWLAWHYLPQGTSHVLWQAESPNGVVCVRFYAMTYNRNMEPVETNIGCDTFEQEFEGKRHYESVWVAPFLKEVAPSDRSAQSR